jgi:hypothetical protein
MTHKITSIFVIFLIAPLLGGCDKLPAPVNEDIAALICSVPLFCRDKNRVILDVQEENYTNYEIAGIRVQPPEKSDARNAGRMVRWNIEQKPPVNIKIWWQVVFDTKTYYLGDYTYDSEKEKGPRPGSVWCEAIVKIMEPYPVNPRHLNLYFFPDGHVEAEVAEQPKSIASEEGKPTSPRLPAGKYCNKTIDNPLYGISTSRPGA